MRKVESSEYYPACCELRSASWTELAPAADSEEGEVESVTNVR